MGSDLKSVLAAALEIPEPPEPCTVQKAFNAFSSKLCTIKVTTPLPETVVFAAENFPHLVKLQYREPTTNDLVDAKCPIVLPSLQAGIFDDSEYIFDPRRERALLDVAHLLRNPHRIHKNLRHGQRGPGRIRGEHVYVIERNRREFWVAFTLFDRILQSSIVVSSFYVSEKWLKTCADSPALYLRPQ